MGSKPDKPHSDFPLFAHASGQWAKKIRGKTHYFGVWADATAALNLYLETRGDLFAGREPRRPGQTTVEDICDALMHAKSLEVASGDLSPLTLRELRETCKRVIDFFGLHAAVDSLRSEDFANFRAVLAAKYGPARLTNEVTRTRQIFHYAYDSGLIDRLPRFRISFRGATKKSRRILRSEKPAKAWGADDLRKLIDGADWFFKPVLLLAINCGFGQTDLSHLPLSAVNLDTAWIEFPRPKTGVHRTCPLWPETVAALRVYLERRGDDAGPLFLTRSGRPLVEFYPASGAVKDAIALRFSRLCKRLDVARPGGSFYGIRHTFQTIADGCRDPVAVSHIMGHADGQNDMSAVYRGSIDPARLIAATEFVRSWLWQSCRAADADSPAS